MVKILFTTEDLIFVYRNGWLALCIEITKHFLWTVLKAAAVGSIVTMSSAVVNVRDGNILFNPCARNIASHFDVRFLACWKVGNITVSLKYPNSGKCLLESTVLRPTFIDLFLAEKVGHPPSRPSPLADLTSDWSFWILPFGCLYDAYIR